MKKQIKAILYGVICAIIISVISGLFVMAFCGIHFKIVIEAIFAGVIFGTMMGIMKYDGMI